MADGKGYFELMALSLLMCTPSDLNQAWADPNADPNAVQDRIDELGFSDLTRARAIDLLEATDKTSARMFFGAAAETLKLMNPEYAGAGAHPPLPAAQILVGKMRELDNLPFKKTA